MTLLGVYELSPTAQSSGDDVLCECTLTLQCSTIVTVHFSLCRIVMLVVEVDSLLPVMLRFLLQRLTWFSSDDDVQQCLQRQKTHVSLAYIALLAYMNIVKVDDERNGKCNILDVCLSVVCTHHNPSSNKRKSG